MDFKKIGARRLSKEQARDIAEYIVKHPHEIESFMDVFHSEDWRYSQYLSHPLGFIAEHNPEVIHHYMPQLITWAASDVPHKSIRRNIVRTWQFMNIEEDHCGDVYDLCYGFLIDPNEAVAVRAFSMSVVLHIVQRFPELAPDAILAIEQCMEKPTPGIRSRARKTLHALRNL